MMHIYILVKGTITVVVAGAANAAIAGDRNNKQAIFKTCAPFTDCISEKTAIQVDNAKEHDIVTPMYDLIEYSDNYSNKSGSLYQFFRDKPKSFITDSE